MEEPPLNPDNPASVAQLESLGAKVQVSNFIKSPAFRTIVYIAIWPSYVRIMKTFPVLDKIHDKIGKDRFSWLAH